MSKKCAVFDSVCRKMLARAARSTAQCTFPPWEKKLRNDVNLGLSSAKNLISLSHPHANGKGEREWVKFRSTQNISGVSQQNRGAFS